MSERACLRCNGEGTVFHKGFTSLEGKVYPDETKPCYGCKGAKVFQEPDYDAIVSAVVSSKGKSKGKLKASWQGSEHYSHLNAARAYYVWRLARFHGGVDMRMPITADMVLRSDPFKPELDKLADIVAKKLLGTDMAAAFRWGKALGMI